MSRRRTHQQGFTLIELLIVVIIIGILAAVATSAYARQRELAKKTACLADRVAIEKAEKSYITLFGTPSANMQALVNAHLLDRVPVCPDHGTYSWASDVDGDVELACSVHSAVSGSTPTQTFASVTGNLIAILMNYYAQHHSWPRSWSPYNFTDLGLDPAQYASPINHVTYKVGGSTVSARPEPGWVMTVTDVNGQKRVLTNNLSWNLWYDATSGMWYYHTVDAANQIDISTLTIAPA